MHRFVTIITLFNILMNVYSFNLDTHIPIIKFPTKSNAYFGFSVTQHQIEKLNGEIEHVIIVGAPKDNITHSDAPEELKNVVNPGVIYKCPISSSTDDCTEIKVRNEAPTPNQDRNNEWFGVSLSSQGSKNGKVVACAHRYKEGRESGTNYGFGVCAVLTNLLDEDDDTIVMPCTEHKKQKDKDMYYYAFCQAGASATFAEESSDVLIGVPGPYNWRGMAYRRDVDPQGIDDVIELSSAVEDQKPGSDDPHPIMGYYSYLGMSTAIGKILNGTKTYVSGAPLSNHTTNKVNYLAGEVLLFKEKDNFLAVEEKHRIHGDQFGARFGASLATIDINNDQLDDLVVGAPLFQTDKFGGAVYVYMNTKKDGITSDTIPIKLSPPEISVEECSRLACNFARFGTSVANIGDIDKDGYPDLAVGAPYEGNGAIYIYRGSKDGLILEPSQRISASHLESVAPLKTFGYSIDGGNDMDGNGSPDIVVGAYGSDKVVVLRSRPVVEIKATIVNKDGKIDPYALNCGDLNCFFILCCFEYSSKIKSGSMNKIDLKYKVVAETFTGKVLSRVYFKGESFKPHEIERSIKLNQNKKGQCKEHQVFIQPANRDILNPIMFRLSYELEEVTPPKMVSGSSLPDINSYPILNPLASFVDYNAEFVKNCHGKDGICFSDLVVKSFFLDLDRKNPVFKYGQMDELVLKIRVNNVNDDAHQATVMINLPKHISYKNVYPDTYKCIPIGQNVTCYIGNPLKKRDIAEFHLRLDPGKIPSTLNELEIFLEANTTSTEVNTDNNKVLIKLQVIVETDLVLLSGTQEQLVFYSGKVRGETSMKTEEDIGSLVIHTYEVKNNGDSQVPNVTVFIDWPYEVESGYSQGKHLLYVLEYSIDEPGVCYFDKGLVNPLDIELNPNYSLDKLKIGQVKSNNKRFKRQAPVQSEPVRDNGRYLNAVIMECDRRKDIKGQTQRVNSAKCMPFQCIISSIEGKNSIAISIRSRLWNSTFIEDYNDVDQVRIYSRARIEIDEKVNIQQTNIKNDLASVLTIAWPQTPDPSPTPLWIYIVAVLGGLLLLAILVIILWRCGFFKRKIDKRTHKGKVYKKSKSTMDPYEDGYN